MKVNALVSIVIVILVMGLVVGGLMFYFKQNFMGTMPTFTQGPEQTPVAVQETQEPLATIFPTPGGEATVSDEELIIQAMAQRHSRPIADVNLTMSDNDGSYAKGGVIFAGDIGGAWWLAAKVSDEWVIVADGNGTVMCDDVAAYSFPVSMVPECWDEATMTLITL